jgi:hypothetical protein
MGAFGDWELNLPRITTTVAIGGSVQTIQWGPTARCSQLAAPPTPDHIPSNRFSLEDWWNGFDLVTWDGESQQLLKRSTSNPLTPTMTIPGTSSSSFPIVTQSHWMIGCLPGTSNGQPGEGFFAVSPGGVKYWFDRLVYEDEPWLKISKSSLGGIWQVARYRASMLVTRMEDRFGNSLVFTYESNSGRLSNITASDNRQIGVQWMSMSIPYSSPAGPRWVVSQVKVQPQLGSAARTYSYGYHTVNYN